MRIALVTHQFLPSYDTGAERLTLNLANQLTRMGHEAIVVTSADRSNGDAPSYAYDGAWVRTVAAGVSLADVLREESSDIVHVMHPMRLPQAFEAAERLDLPVVAHVADFGAVGNNGDGKKLLARAAAVVSPSRWTIERHADEGFDTTAWHHVPWGTDYAVHESRLDPPPCDELVLGLIGTLLPNDAPHVVAKALRLLPDRPIRLLLYGGSFREDEYERELRGIAGDDGRIVFAGSYDHAELPGILAKLSAVVIPSICDENIPMTGLNAIAARVPLITADVGGLGELIDDYRCGFTYRADDPAALAALLAELCDSRALLDDVRQTLVLPPCLEEEAWTMEGIYTDCLQNARP
jgi:glycosyltransferase involved in cell wall biosynthesis